MKHFSLPAPVLIHLLTLIVFSVMSSGNLGAGSLEKRKRFDFKPLVFETPEVQRIPHENGITLFFLEDHELPAIEVYALFFTGAVLEPEGKGGLASLVGQVMRTGGTQDLRPEDINVMLEDRGAVVETSIGTWSGSGYLWSLKEDFDPVMKIFVDMLRNPVFGEEQVNIARGRKIEGIRRRYDRPAGLARLTFGELLYGEDHPLGRLTDSLEVLSITRDDMIKFHREHVLSANLWLGVSGDISLEQVTGAVETYFGDWQGGEQDTFQIPEVPEITGTTYYLIPREIEQTKVIMGHLAPLVTDPDYLPLILGNRIFGGGGIGTSRLWREVRSNRGLAYSVGSSFGFGTFAPGTFTISMGTKTSTAVRAITIVRSELKRLIEAGVTEEEIKRARDYYINSYPFDFSRGMSIVRRTMINEYRNLPPDFLETYPDQISRLTVDDVSDALRRNLDPERMITVVVGNRDEIEPSLSKLGEVTIIEKE